MKGYRPLAVVTLILAAGLIGYIVFAQGSGRHPAGPTVHVQSIQSAKQGPLAPLVLVSFGQSSVTADPGSTFTINVTLSFYSAGDDGMPLTNATSADVTLLAGTPGFSVVRVSYPQFQDNLQKVTILANSIANVQVLVKAPSNGYTGPLSFNVDATNGS